MAAFPRAFPTALLSGLRAILVVGMLSGLAGCAGFGFGENDAPPRPAVEAPPAQQPPAKAPAPGVGPIARDQANFFTPRQMQPQAATLVRVALLLPFNSQRADVRALSTSLYNAAQLALFEFNNPNILLMPKATGGSTTGAEAAAVAAIREGADLIVGPLFAEEVGAVAPVAQASGVPVVAFSTDLRVAGRGVYLLSFPPGEDVNRIVDYAVLQGITRFAALYPQTDYGDRVRALFEQAVADRGSQIVATESYPAGTEGFNAPVQRLANYGGRHGALVAKRTELKTVGDAQGLKALEKRDTLGDPDYQAVFLPEGGQRLKALAPLLPYYDIDPRKVKFLGTGLWDDPSLAREPSLEGGWFPAPAPEAHAQFVTRYTRVYGALPPRIASLAYDAVSLAVALSQRLEGQRFTTEALTTADGFAGVDGIFRFLPDGRTERGLAVLEMRGTGAAVIDLAPASFTVPPAL